MFYRMETRLSRFAESTKVQDFQHVPLLLFCAGASLLANQDHVTRRKRKNTLKDPCEWHLIATTVEAHDATRSSPSVFSDNFLNFFSFLQFQYTLQLNLKCMLCLALMTGTRDE